MKTLSILSAVILSLNLLACSPSGEQTDQNQIAKNVEATEFHKLYTEKGGQMIDVRTAEELEGGYIPKAQNIDFYSDDFDAQIEKLDKNEPIFVYCAAGGRSGQAMSKMKNKGFKEVYNLSGGYGTWANAGFEVTK